MNYIALSKRYWRLHQEEAFSPSESHLYWCLLHQFSEKGDRDVWPETIKMTDGAVATMASVNVKTIDKIRKRLIDRGLLLVEFGGQGNRAGNVYRLVNVSGTSPRTSPETYPKKGEDTGEVRGEVDPTSPKNGEVKGEVGGSLLHEPLHEHTHEPLQKMEKSHIYKEFQTPNTNTNISEAASAAREVPLGHVDAEKKTEQAPPPTPAPKPIPIPPGKTYGDGVLQKQILALYRDYPDLFPLSIYLPFLRHYTAIFQKGKPDLIGTERWRTYDAWDLESKLDNWNKREINAENTNGTFNRPQQSGNDNSAGATAQPVRSNTRPVKRVAYLPEDD